MLGGDGRIVMIALAWIMRQDLAERLADIRPGDAFWAGIAVAPYMIASGQAAYAPASTAWPQGRRGTPMVTRFV
jgi:hypothetical protein